MESGVCFRCSKRSNTLIANHCSDCHKQAKLGKCIKCNVTYSFFNEHPEYESLKNEFEFTCDNCKPIKCARCDGLDKDGTECYSCGEKWCHFCIGEKFSPKMRFCCYKCKCTSCDRAAKANCEGHACKPHCTVKECKVHLNQKRKTLKRTEEEVEEDEESSFSSLLLLSQNNLTQITIKLLTAEERIEALGNDTSVKDSEKNFRKVAINGNLLICMEYLSAWKVEYQKQMEELNKLMEEKNHLKELQKQEFKKIKL
jgi:hypothetical protein